MKHFVIDPFGLLKKYKAYKEQKFLREHGCETWEQYNDIHDPDRDPKKIFLKHIYHGYPYIHVFEDKNHYAYQLLHVFHPRYGIDEINEWCKDNANHKFRIDGMNVIKTVKGWRSLLMTDIAKDNSLIRFKPYAVVAFKDQADYILFCLRWS